ncbi:MAG: DoxX family protein [Ilumatobacteraceae bacterium]
MDIVLVIGRILFALMLLNGGAMHLIKSGPMIGYATHKKVPAAKVAVPVSGVLMVLGSLSIVFGVVADLGALVLAVILVAMAVKMHDFWAADEQSKQMETIQFLKNLSMAGAALVMFAAIAGADAGARVIGPMVTDGFFSK